MKKLLVALTALTLTFSSCKTVYSTTSIEPKKSFVLGDNDHDSFEVTLKNISTSDLEVAQKPNDGNKQLIQVLEPKKSMTVTIGKNTALFIYNKSNNKASVELNLKSNTHLSMGYKN